MSFNSFTMADYDTYLARHTIRVQPRLTLWTTKFFVNVHFLDGTLKSSKH